MRTLWRYHRRAVLMASIPLLALLVILGLVALVLRVASGGSTPSASRTPVHGPQTSAPSSTSSTPTTAGPAAQAPSPATPSDIASWDAIPPTPAAVSATYPAITAPATTDPYAYAAAFVTEMFSQDYRQPRSELLSWAQYESVPLITSGLPPADEAKGLVDSMTDITWDNEPTAPVPSVGEWLSLQAQAGYSTVSGVTVTADSLWLQEVAAGHSTPDKKMVVLDASLTASLHTTTAGQATTSPSQVSLKLMLGTSTHGDGYGVMYVGTYVVTAVN